MNEIKTLSRNIPLIECVACGRVGPASGKCGHCGFRLPAHPDVVAEAEAKLVHCIDHLQEQFSRANQELDRWKTRCLFTAMIAVAAILAVLWWKS
jgi:hypothetical protein